MFFRFIIPGFGPINIEASNLQEAIRRAGNFLRSQNVVINQSVNQALNNGAQVSASSLRPGDRIIRRDPSETTFPDDSDAGDRLLQEAVRSGRLAPEDIRSDSQNQSGAVETTPADLSGRLPVDPGQDFPLGAFENALSARGFNNEGLLAPTLNQAFSRLAPALRLGQLTGELAPIGEQPGGLQNFFETRLNQASTLPLQMFTNLRNRGQQGIDFGSQAGELNIQELLDLARAAANNQFGAFTTQLLPSNTTVLRRLDRERAAGTPPSNLANFFATQFSL